ncbi:MAG: hypothetical protein Kow00107_02470 [Planctomycetota bacterium]
MRRLPEVLIVLALTMAILLHGTSLTAENVSDIPWHFASHSYRTIFALKDTSSRVANAVRKGLLYARLDVRTLERERPDGSDIRVVNENGELLRAWSGKRDGLGNRVLYCRPGNAKFVIVYYGAQETGPEPPNLLKDFPSNLYGLTLSYYYSPATSLMSSQTLAKFISSYDAQKTEEVDRVRLRKSPFSRDIPFIAVFDGYFLADVDGTYFFGTDSHGGSYIDIDGKNVAEWPGEHWRQGNYVHGTKVYLRRGVYSFRYMNQRIRGGIMAEAGWAAPGFPDQFEIPPDRYVRFVPLVPVLAQEKSGRIFPSFLTIVRHPVSLNDSEPLTHLELRGYSKNPDALQWTLTTSDAAKLTLPYVLPYKVYGPKAEFFLERGISWQVSVAEGEGAPMNSVFNFAKPRKELVLPFHIESEMDTLPYILFRNKPFGLLVNTPNDTGFTPVIDLTVELTPDGKEARRASVRRNMEEGRHVVFDAVFDPRVPEFFALPGIPFVSKPSKTGDPSFYDSTVSFRTDINGITVTRQLVKMLTHEKPIPDDLDFDFRGYMVSGNAKLLVVSEIEDDRALRRWAPIKAITSLSESYSSFLIVGDSYADGEKGMPDLVAELLREKGAQAVSLSSADGRPYPAYASITRAFPLLQKNEPDCVVIALGYGDVFSRTPSKIIETMVQAFVSRARGKGVKKTVLLLPPVVPGYEPICEAYREALLRTASRLKLSAIDLHPILDRGFDAGGFSLQYPTATSLDAAAKTIADCLRN